MTTSIALLICDTPIPSVLLSHGDYHSIFTTLLQSSLPSGDHRFVLDPYNAVKLEYPSQDEVYDAFLITGSAASAYEDVEWINQLVAYVASIPKKRPKAKIFGMCFGHQIVARAFGGECVPNNGIWEVGITEVDLTSVGKEIFGVTTLNIQQMHRDHVPALPSNFQLLGSTPIAYNQGMVRYASTPTLVQADDLNTLNDVHILTLQGHPEFTKPIVSAIVAARSKSGVIKADLAADVKRREDMRNDGVSVVGRTIWGILGVDTIRIQ